MDNVINLRDEPLFALEAEVCDRIKTLIHEYDGRLSLVAALGILEVVKHELLQTH